MTDPDQDPPDEAGVLSSLPGTRPQRRSSKRAPANPARRAAEAETNAAPDDDVSPSEAASPDLPRPPGTRRPRAATGAPKATRRPPAAAAPRDESHAARTQDAPPVAAQGFEADPVHWAVEPPTGGELLASIAQGATELAEIGLALGRRLARSMLDRLPRL